MAGEYVFTISDLKKSYGTKTILENIHLSFYHGAKIGIVGENGSGKSTLLKIIPVLHFEGLIVKFTSTPLCKPTPCKSIFSFMVFWLDLSIMFYTKLIEMN